MRWARPLGLILAVLSFVGAGALLPDLEQRTEKAGLRYTDSVVEGALGLRWGPRLVLCVVSWWMCFGSKST